MPNRPGVVAAVLPNGATAAVVVGTREAPNPVSAPNPAAAPKPIAAGATISAPAGLAGPNSPFVDAAKNVDDPKEDGTPGGEAGPNAGRVVLVAPPSSTPDAAAGFAPVVGHVPRPAGRATEVGPKPANAVAEVGLADPQVKA
jgi:hypothetical protein